MGAITIGLDPDLELGPITVAWHGLTIALGILVGALIAGRWARARGFAVDPLYTIGVLLALGGIVGSRLFYVLEREPSDLLSPSELLSTRGFTFAGGLIVAAALIAIYVRRSGLSARYIDCVAFALAPGVAVGRVGDIINGEHYGDPSDSLLAVRNSHPDALTPDPAVAYHNGGLYEVLITLVVFAIVWPLRHRLRRTGDLSWLVLGLFAAGRFFEFFWRSDSPDAGLGLSSTQWTSLILLATALVGWLATSSRFRDGRGERPYGDASA